MTDKGEQPQGGNGTQSQGDGGQSQGESKTNSVSLSDALLKIEALEKDNAAYRRKQREADTAKSIEDNKRLTEQQKFEELATKQQEELNRLRPLAETADVLTQAFKANLEKRLAQIPEDIRKTLVDPVLEGMSPVKFSQWLDDNWKNLTLAKAPPLDGGAGGSGSRNAAQVTPEAVQMAQAMGMTVETYLKRQAEIKQQREMPDNEWDTFQRQLQKPDDKK